MIRVVVVASPRLVAVVGLTVEQVLDPLPQLGVLRSHGGQVGLELPSVWCGLLQTQALLLELGHAGVRFIELLRIRILELGNLSPQVGRLGRERLVLLRDLVKLVELSLRVDELLTKRLGRVVDGRRVAASDLARASAGFGAVCASDRVQLALERRRLSLDLDVLILVPPEELVGCPRMRPQGQQMPDAVHGRTNGGLRLT